MKVLTHLNPIDQSVPTLQRDRQGQSKFCFWPFMLEGCVVPYLPLHAHGRRVCGKSKRWAIENVFGHCE